MRIVRPKHLRLLSHEKRLSSSGFKLIAGIDEAGRGPLAGPVVAGAVILKSYSFKERIDDSKKLSVTARRRAFDEILTKAIVGVGIVGEKVIDEINIYQATIRAMQEAIRNLSQKPDYLIVDGRMKFDTECPMKSIVNGDALSLSIAAASIVAKVKRDEIMLKYDEEFPQYKFSSHKGYPTKSHKAALLRYGVLSIHRKTFAPIKNFI